MACTDELEALSALLGCIQADGALYGVFLMSVSGVICTGCKKKDAALVGLASFSGRVCVAQALRRPSATKPIRPMPSRASGAGSGTVVGVS